MITIPDVERTRPVRGGEGKGLLHIQSMQHNEAEGQKKRISHETSRANCAERREKTLMAALAESNLTVERLRGEVAAATAACAEAVAQSPVVAGPAPRGPAPAPTPTPTPGARAGGSLSSRKRAARTIRQHLKLYPEAAHADILARVIVVDGRGKGRGISVSLVKQLLANPHMAVHMKNHGESILAAAKAHMQSHVFSATNFTTARRLLRLSYRKLEWLRRLLSHDGRTPRLMHPDFDESVPSLPCVPAMRSDEHALLEREGGICQQVDGAGAVCEDLDRTLCQGIALKAQRGELASTGTREDPHIYLWGGDGFMARKKSKWVQLGAILISTTSLNQSPTDSRFVMAYRGGEDYDVLNIRLEDLRPTLQRLEREGVLLDEAGELPVGVGKHVAFALGGDKPWLMTVLGRRNMNHTYFSPHCTCTRENITCLSCEGGQDGHYSFDADESCRASHVCPNMWLRGGAFMPFVCPHPECAKRFDRLADVEAEETQVSSLSPGDFKRFAEKFSHGHGGKHWNSGVLLPARWLYSDPLHLFLNLFKHGLGHVP